jgi:hypothetical protein
MLSPVSHPKNEEVSPCYFLPVACYAEIGPCYFLRGISLETLMESAFVDDIVVILAPILRFSPVFCPVTPGKLTVGTSSGSETGIPQPTKSPVGPFEPSFN